MSGNETIENLINSLKQQRDELYLKLKLGNAEAKEQWEILEKKLAKLSSKADQVGDVAEATGEQVLEATKLAVDEVRKGYERIRKML